MPNDVKKISPGLHAQHPETCTVDSQLINVLTRMARKLTPAELHDISQHVLPAAVDWSRFCTLIRDQGTTSTCIVQALAACVDILKERERRFSPNNSAWFIAYVYWVCQTHELPPDPRFPGPVDGQGGVLVHNGCCSESSYSSRKNYVPANPTAGTPIHMAPPPDAAVTEAAGSKIAAHPVHDGPTLIALKYFLSKGPVWEMCGGHAMCFVGYNDATQQFKLVDSAGDRANGGFRYWSYSEITALLPGMRISPLINAHTPSTSYEFVGRIRFRHEVARGLVRVLVGTSTSGEVEVWPTPDVFMNGDKSQHLTLTFPLPAFAAAHWPPSALNQWYVRFIETSSGSGVGSVVGEVEEVSLVQHLPNGTPIIYRSSASTIPIRNRSSMRVYVPTQIRNVLTISGSIDGTVGQTAKIGGMLSARANVADGYVLSAPLALRKIQIYRIGHDPIEQTLLEEEVGNTVTDGSGKYQIPITLSGSADFEGIATDNSNTTIATSPVLHLP